MRERLLRCVAGAKFPTSFQLNLGGKKMKNLVLVFVFAFAFCPMAMASDIAFYVGAPNTDGWYDVATQTADVETIITETGHLFKDVQQFDDDQYDAFGAWVDENTDDGEMDILWLNGCMPSVLYPFPNLEPDGSLIEEWLDGGNMIINVGDWFGYVSYAGGSRQTENGTSGAANILDLSSGIIVSADNTSLTVTPTGHEYLPSLPDTVITYRPIALAAVVDPWEVAAVFASTDGTDNGAQTDPIVIHNTETDGYVAFINQSAGSGPPGWLDDRGLTCAEFIGNWVNDVIGLGRGNPLARRPSPKDGTLHEDTWVSLSWSAGVFTVSHDVYFGENFDDVNNATNESDTFQGNQSATFFVAGFPGFPYPEGLVPGTTYYWRIDEVNEADPNSPWKGNVWSITIPPKTAYDPLPTDGSKFVDLDVQLSWTAGFGAKLHYVYFGDNFDDVNNASGGLPQGSTTFSPSALENEKTYYWRIDEFDPPATHKGPVWSFTTARAGGGIKGEYFNNMDLAGVPVLTRIDPQINFYWNPGPNPPPGVNEDSFSVRWTGEVEAPFSEPVTFITGSDDGVRLYFDGVLVIDDWTDHDRTENRSEPIELVAGQTYGIVMEGYENAGEAEWQLYWQSPSMSRQLVPQAALSPPIKAGSPKPSNGAVDVKHTQILSWSPGENAASHQVYFGTDEEAVKNANTGSPEYKGPRNLGSESYDPGKLEWDTVYYWRVDEVEDGGTIQTGNLWSFTTANFLIVDDFEDYDVGNNEIWWSWKDGLGYAAHDNEPAYAGNGTGSAVGDETSPSYMEENIVHGGRQAMPLFYDNNKQGFFKYSEAELTLVYPRDWTEKGVNRLTIWFRGDSANVVETLYVALNGSAVVTNDNPNAVLVTDWTEWNIDLQVFTDQGMGLTNVNTIALGLGNKMNPLAGGSGVMYFDDIQLHLPAEPAP